MKIPWILVSWLQAQAGLNGVALEGVEFKQSRKHSVLITVNLEIFARVLF